MAPGPGWLQTWRWYWRPDSHLKREILASQTHNPAHDEAGAESARVHWVWEILSRWRPRVPGPSGWWDPKIDWFANWSAHEAASGSETRFSTWVLVGGVWGHARTTAATVFAMRVAVVEKWTTCCGGTWCRVSPDGEMLEASGQAETEH